MPDFAFQTLPEQAHYLLHVQSEIHSDFFVGFNEAWNMPLGLWHAPDGFDTSYDAHAHGSLSFVLGGGPVERMDGPYAGRKGGLHPDCFMLYPGGPPRRYVGARAIRLCHIYFQPSFVAWLHEQEDLPSEGLELCDDRILVFDPVLRRKTDEYVRRASDKDHPPGKIEMDAWSVLIGTHLLRHHSNRRQHTEAARGRLSERQLRSALEYMETHLAKDASLAQLALAAGLPVRRFCAAFRASTGLPPHQYVMRLRIERAKRLLDGEQSLAQIAFACGFGSQQHLTTSFRTLVGTPPAAWRRSKHR